MIYKETNSLNPIGRPLPPKVAHRGNADVVVKRGNHNVEGGNQKKRISNLISFGLIPRPSGSETSTFAKQTLFDTPTALPRGCSLEIFHFPIRHRQQLLNKIIKGGAAYERNTDLAPGAGRARRELYRRYNEMGNLDEYLNNEIHDLSRIEEKLNSGKLIIDERLKNYMESLTN